MTRDELLKFHATCCERMAIICAAKNSDYAGQGGASPFANFTRVEALGIASTETGFLTRMVDKIARVTSLFASGGVGAVKDESEEDTLLDLANYCILLAAYRREKRLKADEDRRFDLRAAVPRGLMDDGEIRRACDDRRRQAQDMRDSIQQGDRLPTLNKETGVPDNLPWSGDPNRFFKRES